MAAAGARKDLQFRLSLFAVRLAFALLAGAGLSNDARHSQLAIGWELNGASQNAHRLKRKAVSHDRQELAVQSRPSDGFERRLSSSSLTVKHRRSAKERGPAGCVIASQRSWTTHSCHSSFRIGDPKAAVEQCKTSAEPPASARVKAE